MPKKYKVEITELAEKDILSIFRHIAKDSEQAAKKWVNEVEKQFETLVKFPKRGPVIPEAEELEVAYRHLVYGNYRTIFRLYKKKVFVLRVVHSSQLLKF
ncbi:MAG: type II toxin-antitoxin system RelE/ParE family toxin [Elusimicrobiota bacterium]